MIGKTLSHYRITAELGQADSLIESQRMKLSTSTSSVDS
jgi:hypothetical protein